MAKSLGLGDIENSGVMAIFSSPLDFVAAFAGNMMERILGWAQGWMSRRLSVDLRVGSGDARWHPATIHSILPTAT
jgi:hypothetical protein